MSETKKLKTHIRDLNRAVARLSSENKALRSAVPITAAIEALVPAASRAFRTFERAAYDDVDMPSADVPINEDLAGDFAAMPSITVVHTMSMPPEARYTARVECFYRTTSDGDDGTLLAFAYGDSCGDPLSAVASLGESLALEPDEDGIYASVAAREHGSQYEIEFTDNAPHAGGGKPN